MNQPAPPVDSATSVEIGEVRCNYGISVDDELGEARHVCRKDDGKGCRKRKHEEVEHEQVERQAAEREEPRGGVRNLRPQVFTKRSEKRQVVKNGERLRRHIVPIFRNPEDCYKALMLWCSVGDTIPLDSRITAEFKEELTDPSFMHELHGDDTLSFVGCSFDTRAEVVRPGEGALLYLAKLQMCLSKYAKATGLHSGKQVPYFDPKVVTSFLGLFCWIRECEPNNFEADLLKIEAEDKKVGGRQVGRHLCFNGITNKYNKGHPCTHIYHGKLGPQSSNIEDVGVEAMIIKAKSRSLADVAQVLEITSSMADEGLEYGFLTDAEKPHIFRTKDRMTMRKIVEQVYDMPGLKLYFEKFTAMTLPDHADHPSRGRWTEQAEDRLVRLFAVYHKVSSKTKIFWDKIKLFADQHQGIMPPYEQAAWNNRLRRIRKENTNDMSLSSFLPLMRKYLEKDEFPEDRAFMEALAQFKIEN